MVWKYKRELVLVRKLNTQPYENLRNMNDGMYGDQRKLRTGEIDELYTLDITGLACILLFPQSKFQKEKKISVSNEITFQLQNYRPISCCRKNKAGNSQESL